jgi:hypothetical protein
LRLLFAWLRGGPAKNFLPAFFVASYEILPTAHGPMAYFSDLLFTQGFRIEDSAVLRAADAICLQAKNLTNQAIHCVDMFLAALEFDGRVRPDASPYQLEMLERANAAVMAINAKRARFNAGGAKGGNKNNTKNLSVAVPSKKKERKGPRPLFGQPDQDGDCPSPWDILEMPILGHMVERFLDADGHCV